MTQLRVVALFLGSSLIIGELWRSWGAGRSVLLVIDDVLMGGALVIAAVLIGQNTVRRRAFFSGSWGLCAGMLYGSFFVKIVAPNETVGGNWNPTVLTALIGVAFAVSVFGLIASIIANKAATKIHPNLRNPGEKSASK